MVMISLKSSHFARLARSMAIRFAFGSFVRVTRARRSSRNFASAASSFRMSRSVEMLMRIVRAFLAICS